jgi:transcriptional regulator with XRE-family HTH domain
MRSDREKAETRDISGPYKELAVEVRRMLGYYSDDIPLLSARQAALRSGINHATISALIQGARASRETLKQLASAFGTDELLLLRLAGYATTGRNEPDPVKAGGLEGYVGEESLPERIYHRIERLSKRDLLRLDKLLEVWVDDGQEVGS